MGFWSIVVPETTTNLPTNTSFETGTASWATDGANTIAQSSEQSRFGAYSLKCTYQNDVRLAFYAITLTANAHSLAAYVYIPSNYDGTDLNVKFAQFAGGAGTSSVSADMTLTDQWQRVEVPNYVIDVGDLAGNIRIAEDGAAPTVGRFVYVDAVQCEALDHVTTYCDGDQPGCEWNGAEHASTSTRSALSRGGGRVYDLTDDYSFYVTGVLDSGVVPLTQHLDEYAIIEGGEIPSYKVHPRILTLQGFMFSRAGHSALHALIQSLIDILKPDAVPENQPILLRYTEATATKEIAVRYEAGIAGNYRARWCAQQLFQLRFIAADPFWYEIGESAAVLDTNDTDTLRYVAGRLRSTGQWDDLGLAADPTTNGTVYAVLVGSDNQLYIGGDFTGWNGVAGRDYVATYDPSTDTWSTWGNANDFDDIVYALIEGPDGTIYAGGRQTVIGGGATDHLAEWTGGAWATVGNPILAPAAVTDIRKLAYDSTGNLIIVGTFLNLGGDGNADYVGMWTGAAYSTPGGVATGGVATTTAVALDEADNIYIGFEGLNWNGDGDAAYFAWFDNATSTWEAVNDTAFDAAVRALLYDSDLGLLYLGGVFTNAGGVAAADYLATWNGQTFAALGPGLASTLVGPSVRSFLLTPDGSLYMGGYRLETAGDITLLESLVRWNGSVFSNMDVDLPGQPHVLAMAHGPVDPIVPANFDLYFGYDTTGAGLFSGTVTITNDGTTEARPVFAITRAGGTSATVAQIRNETTGTELLFDYDLLDGETLTIDLGDRSVTSSFWEDRPEALLATSDDSSFILRSGINQITAFVSTVGGPTITATAVYRDKYWSTD